MEIFNLILVNREWGESDNYVVTEGGGYMKVVIVIAISLLIAEIIEL